MTHWLAALFLVAGALLCLIASIGVLRLPDFFLRLHAATKAGVTGCGLVLLGVALAEPSFGLWLKVTIAMAFLLLTTPIAGHLLGRAGYVAGVPLWSGTKEDQLRHELRRGRFDQPVSDDPRVGRVRPALKQIVLCLIHGPAIDAAIRHAVTLAASHGAELVGLAIVDTKRLQNVGPVPIGGNYYAAQLRTALISRARHAVADVIQLFEQAATHAGIRFRVAVLEGDPILILRQRQRDDVLLLLGRDAWFDQGALKKPVDPLIRLIRRGIRPVLSVGRPVPPVRRVGFLHDGSRQSDDTWQWLLDLDPWPRAELRLEFTHAVRPQVRTNTWAQARDRGRSIEEPEGSAAAGAFADCEVLVLGNGSPAGWLKRWKPGSHAASESMPLIVFG